MSDHYVIIRLPKVIEYEPGRTKELHSYNEFLTERGRFQANGFDLDDEDFDEYGLRDVDGNRVSVFPASFHDEYNELERGPQIMMRKDIGHLITACGITGDTRVLDAGTGSGALAIYLSRVADHVTTVERDEDTVQVARKNAEVLGDDITVRHGDIKDLDTVRGDYDVVTLDVPGVWEALPTVNDALRIGGFMAAYTPHISQVQHLVSEAPQSLHHQSTVDVSVTSWNVGEDILRPETSGVKHTGFISTFRRIDR